MQLTNTKESPVYDGETWDVERNGRTYRVEVQQDPDAQAPWDHMTPLGEVTGWKSWKGSNERIIHADGSSYRCYDFAGAVAAGRKEGWTGEQAVKAAEWEFEYFRQWCADLWGFVGVTVTLLDQDGEDTDFYSSLWGRGIESFSGDYIRGEVVTDCISEIEHNLTRFEGVAL